MKTIEQLDITAPLLKEEFFILYDTQLPLNQEEKDRVNEIYFGMYALLVTKGLKPELAFQAVKLHFLDTEIQIKERIK
jgi:hypothetical protein